MSDHVRSDDDNVESGNGPAEDGRGRSASDHRVDPEGVSSLDRQISEPPPPDQPGVQAAAPVRSTPGFTEWLTDWEDLRSAPADPSPTYDDRDGGSRDTRELPALPAETPFDEVVGAGAAEPGDHDNETDRNREEPAATDGAPNLGADVGDEEPTLPNPASRIPSPPPVRSKPAVQAPTPVRLSRPQPVSGAAPGYAPGGRTQRSSTDLGGIGAFTVAPPGSIAEVDEYVVDRARNTTSHSVRLGGLDVTIDASQRAMLVTAVIGMVVVAGLFAFLLSGLGGQTDTTSRQGDASALISTDGPDLDVSASTPPVPSTSELAQTTVRVAGLDENGRMVCAGSGVLVGEEGVILTNAHVVRIDEKCPFTTIAIGVTLDTADPPELRYQGEVLVSDDALDLAVVRIVGGLPPNDELDIEPNFPVATLGDSDDMELGDTLRLLGYPVIGGETITQTSGSFSGFVAQDGIGSRALMKTDAALAAGSSGGMAVNDNGEVVGIPMKAGANEQGSPVDCRPISDTNNDGQQNNDDNCVPIGGYLNSVRPINLARDLLARAEAIQTDAGRAGIGSPRVEIDLSQVAIWNPRFSTGEVHDSPIDEVVTLAEGVEEICMFVDWSGIPNGVPWTAVWSHNGEQIKAFSIVKEWEYGESGRNFWYCAEDRRGHPAGVYEVGLFLNDDLAFVEAIEVTPEQVETFDVTWVNKSGVDICGLAVNPQALSRHAGVNELEPGEKMEPGDSIVVELPEGDVVVEAYDCSGTAIAAELEGLSIPTDILVDGELVPFVIGGDAGDGSDG